MSLRRKCRGGALDNSPRHPPEGYADGRQINKEGRDVGLDFYDLLIEGDFTSVRRLFAKIPVSDCNGDISAIDMTNLSCTHVDPVQQKSTNLQYVMYRTPSQGLYHLACRYLSPTLTSPQPLVESARSIVRGGENVLQVMQIRKPEQFQR